MVTDIKRNIEIIREKMARAAEKAGRRPSEIKLMGVTKYHPVEMMIEAEPYLDLIGENKVMEAFGKRDAWNGSVLPWHMIGHLQRNKARRALMTFDLIESVDKLETASAINRIAAETRGEDFKYPVFIEVNISRETAKSGAAPEDAEALLCGMLESCPNLSPEGLMTVAADTDDEAVLRSSFAELRELRDRLSSAAGVALPELSMGMSGDFAEAIAEGSTIVRIGSAIFGPRNY